MPLCLEVRMQMIWFCCLAKCVPLGRVAAVCVCVCASVACESLGIAFVAFQRRALIAWLLTGVDPSVRITASAATTTKRTTIMQQQHQQSRQCNEWTLGCACQWFVQRIATNKSKQHTYLQRSHTHIHMCARKREDEKEWKHTLKCIQQCGIAHLLPSTALRYFVWHATYVICMRDLFAMLNKWFGI